jgi:TetR/AcrR family transcriptional regulator, transcriptional repressor for nem operon
MGRPKSFDRGTALDAAVDLFWERGYERTSIDDLVNRLNVSRPALYREWPTKHELWLEALDQYRAAGHAAFTEELAARPADAAVIVRKRLFQLVADDASDDLARGCLVVNATCEQATADSQTKLRVADSMERLERSLTEALTAARDAGTIDHNNPAALARTIVVIIQGLRVVAKARPGPAAVDGVIDEVVSAMKVRGSE